ncbi:hypothetical protein [Streptosporangium sp. NPDC006930]|uniref:hypothetical protein n=1 Tax=unclassified Streptosporangium TaxID=2632669 RepID=UPI00343DC360
MTNENHIPAAEDSSLFIGGNTACEVEVVQRCRLTAERPAVLKVSLPTMSGLQPVDVRPALKGGGEPGLTTEALVRGGEADGDALEYARS